MHQLLHNSRKSHNHSHTLSHKFFVSSVKHPVDASGEFIVTACSNLKAVYIVSTADASCDTNSRLQYWKFELSTCSCALYIYSVSYSSSAAVAFQFTLKSVMYHAIITYHRMPTATQEHIRVARFSRLKVRIYHSLVFLNSFCALSLPMVHVIKASWT